MTITAVQPSTALSVDKKADNMERAMLETLQAIGAIRHRNDKSPACSIGHYPIIKKTRVCTILHNKPGSPQRTEDIYVEGIRHWFVAKKDDIFVAVNNNGNGGALTRPLRYDAVTHEIVTRTFVDPRGPFALKHYDDIMAGLKALP